GQPVYTAAPNMTFSFSSCQLGMMAGWSATHDIGVDIEDPTREVEIVDVAKRFFAPSEAAALSEQATPERETHFFQLWTLKEAALKSIGHGLAYGLEAFAFEVSPQLRVASAPDAFGGPSRFDPHLIESGGSSAALVLHDRLPSP
ncbi:MAG: 4'-phosphopantetheinyl transferase superfamily protein, partial [Pseudomonadota bacterium]